MVAHAFLVVTALTERTRYPAPSELVGLTCNDLQHLFPALSPDPLGISAIDWAGQRGDAGIRQVPTPATTDDRPPQS
jgi:hypothetical protein